MKKINYILFSILFFFISIGIINANSISRISMDIYIDNEGNAKIQEVWEAKLDKGTEGYHPYYNLGNSTITINSVYDDLGNEYTRKEWDVDDSFSDKAKRFGIYKTGGETDICWGITEYGKRKYTINYTISNFIYNTTDGNQILYWQLIPYELSSKPNDVYIKVHADKSFADTLDVWGYGNKGGTCYVYDGYIEMQSKGTLDSKEYMTMLVKFPGKYFNTENKINKSFDDVLKMAEEGADKYDPFWDKVWGFFLAAIPFIVTFLIIIFAAKSGNGKNRIKGKVIPSKKDLLPFRDLPCKDDYYMAYLIASEYNLYKQQTDMLGAVILKWIKNGNVEITSEEKGVFNSKTSKLHLVKEPTDLSYENDLYNMMYEASKDGILENNEFKKYCNNHYTKVLNWFEKVLDNKYNEIRNNKEYIDTVQTKGMFGGTKEVLGATNKTNELGKQMAGLKLFFKDFTSMNEKEPIEVKMWRDYLIYAQILGMAEKVAKEFKNLYPKEITDQDYNYVMYVHTFSHTGVSAATTARQRAQSYSSGGGGFSSGGGGGGSFGGGGGGGGFR